jgi:hypothetical protein
MTEIHVTEQPRLSRLEPEFFTPSLFGTLLAASHLFDTIS